MQAFNPEIEKMPRERLRALQVQKLRNLLHHIIGRNRFYTRKLKEVGALPDKIRSLDDFSKLPFTYKSELLRDHLRLPVTGWARFTDNQAD